MSYSASGGTQSIAGGGSPAQDEIGRGSSHVFAGQIEGKAPGISCDCVNYSLDLFCLCCMGVGVFVPIGAYLPCYIYTYIL